MTTRLAQQAAAIETARRIILGAAIKPTGSQKQCLADQLQDAAETTRLFAIAESEIRELVRSKQQ